MKPLQFSLDFVNEVTEALRREAGFYRKKPMTGTLFLTYRCSSRCATCTMWRRNGEQQKELSLPQWEYVVDALHREGMRAVELFGGDVFMRKEVTLPLIRRLKEKGCVIHLPTNSNLVDPETAQQLIDIGVDVIYLSTDGVGDSHDRIRGVPGSFDRVQRAVGALVAARVHRGGSRTRIVCNTTVSKFNVHQLETITRFACKSGFDEQHFEYVGELTNEQIDRSLIDGLRPSPYYVRQGESVLLSREQAVMAKNTLKEIKQKYEKYMHVQISNIENLSVDDLANGTVPFRKCYVERTEVTVDPYGNIVACPFVNNYVLGNIFQGDFQGIWRGASHRQFQRYQNGKKIGICTRCILSVQRSHDFNERLRRILGRRFVDNLLRMANH